MIKYTSHNIKASSLNFVIDQLIESNKYKTLYISACRQFIKVTKNQVYNIITGNTSIPIQYLDKFNKEIITLNIKDSINYIKSKTEANVSFKAGGIIIIDESIICDNVKILVTLKINTIEQLSKLITDPDSIILKLEKLKQDSIIIDYNNLNIRTLIIDNDNIFTNLFLSGEMIRRLIKLSSIGIIETCITNDEVLIVEKFQSFIYKKINVKKSLDWNEEFSENSELSNFNIADLFVCYGNTFGPIHFGIKLIGAKKNCDSKVLKQQTKICLNYIKHMGKLQEVISKLEQIKLSII